MRKILSLIVGLLTLAHFVDAGCEFTYGSMDVSPGSLNFGSVNVGQRVAETFTIKNLS
jgi:hypothetical protein